MDRTRRPNRLLRKNPVRPQGNPKHHPRTKNPRLRTPKALKRKQLDTKQKIYNAYFYGTEVGISLERQRILKLIQTDQGDAQ